jgi:hypothetical protein
LRNSILPRWDECSIGSITALDVAIWRKQLRSRYAVSTFDGIMCLLSMMMEDAVDQRMIEANPVHRKRRRGRRQDKAPSRLEKVWALPENVVRIAVQAGMRGGPMAENLSPTTACVGVFGLVTSRPVTMEVLAHPAEPLAVNGVPVVSAERSPEPPADTHSAPAQGSERSADRVTRSRSQPALRWNSRSERGGRVDLRVRNA